MVTFVLLLTHKSRVPLSLNEKELLIYSDQAVYYHTHIYKLPISRTYTATEYKQDQH